jgi:hypothetical protein
MRREKESQQSMPDPRSLEERLRRLPLPAVPAELRERILSAAPRIQPAPKRVRPVLWWSMGGLSVAVAVVLVAFLVPFFQAGRHSVVQMPTKVPSPPGVLYAATTDPKETDPCYVLPPMPEWRS